MLWSNPLDSLWENIFMTQAQIVTVEMLRNSTELRDSLRKFVVIHPFLPVQTQHNGNVCKSEEQLVKADYQK